LHSCCEQRQVIVYNNFNIVFTFLSAISPAAAQRAAQNVSFSAGILLAMLAVKLLVLS